jgi:transcriptional regulator with XRE-family HTH domain
MANLRSQFGTRVRYLRRQRDMTQEQLAEAANISVDFLSLVERGINAPSFDTLERLAEALKVELRDLFDFPK